MGTVGIIRPGFRIGAQSRRHRTLGEQFYPRRGHYIVQIPFGLFIVGIFSWLVPNEIMMVFACCVGSVVGVFLIYDWLLRRRPLRISTVYAIGLLLGYCLGTMNTWLTEPRGGLSLSDFFFRDPAVLTRAVSSVLFASGILIAVGELYERPIFGEEFRLKADSRVVTFIYTGTAVIIVGFLTKRMTLGGAAASATGQVSPINAFMLWLFFPLVAITVSIFLGMPSGTKKKIMGLIAGLLLVLLMTQTRRNQIYTGFLILMSLRFSGYKMRGSIIKKAIYLMLFLAMTITGALSYQLLRSLGRFGDYKQVPLIPRIQRAAELFEEGTALSTALNVTQKNVQRRTFVLTFYADVLDLSSLKPPAYGGDAITQIQEALPSVLFPSKVLKGEEEIANEQFGMNNNDQPNSLLTAGAIDFGLLGAMVYPLILAFILRKFVELAQTYLPALQATLVVLSFVFICVQTEMTVIGYAIVIRNSILFTVLLLALLALPSFSLRSQN